ncbi:MULTISPECIES: hypothetical protein [Streptomyces]|uniref:Uncharacterized protein n=1 Tax=Streptomyces koelreuteriae TaxID=2838015 RepID=A0ABX8FQL1_9ACTN|nr:MULTISPECIES: hypothetical protein [Streptomyces]QWB23327.1 hypothetical protein KJK29_12330 [Streptomyces koelreuteriae]UUA06279.1 hypothetical protein NNW98_12385 [Streptomyces koelreuteriae]UUA13906.1 hypothetical protein NNW99_12385 [Streptomyces sp. CRCS-T-1]
MNPTEHAVAWEHPPTRRAWSMQLAANVLALLGWIALWTGLLAILVVFVPPGYTILFVPFLLYSFYRAFIQLFVFPVAFGMRRVLREHPWCLYRDAAHGLADRPDVVGRQCGWFEFPNPARPEERLPMVFPRHWGVGWWHRRMAPRAAPEVKAQIGLVWLAGDPRFIGVIAAPASDESTPRRFRFLSGNTGSDGERSSLADRGATAEDIERGRRAGVRLARS